MHYIEGCSAPVYTTDSLHSAVVEIIVKPQRPGHATRRSRTGRPTSTTSSPSGPGSRPRATWSGSTATSARKLTMKYPAVVMVGPKAHGEVLSVAYAGAGQHQDAGAKMIHAAPETTSKIVSKSISQGRRPHHLPRPGAGRGGRLRLQEPRAVRRADPRRGLARADTYPVHGDRRAGRPASATRPRSRRSATSSSST